jgi:iron complex outermembrane receptor protein
MLRIVVRSLLCGAGASLAVSMASAQTVPPAETGTAPPANAGAGAQSDRGLEEIVVTARKRSESLLDVPVAVTAISAVQIPRQGISDLNRLAQMAPQVILARGDSGAGASFTIRGVGSPKGDAGIEQSVTLAIDGVQVTRGNFINQGLFDLAQVEVLKGPQALFFGKNSPAGVISLTTASPSREFGGYARVGYEAEAREVYAEAAVTGPLTDTLSGRIAVRGTTMRGWVKNVAGALPAGVNPFLSKGSPGAGHDYSPGARELMGRVSLKWEPSDAFDALLKVGVATYHDNGTTTQAYCTSGAGPSDLGVTDPFLDCKFDNKLASVGVNPGYIVDWPFAGKNGETYTKSFTALTSLTMNLKLDNVTFTSVTGYYDLDYQHANGYSFTSLGNLYVPIAEKTRGLSQELRMVTDYDGPLNFTLGAFYDNIKRRNWISTFGGDVGPDPRNGKYHTFENTPEGWARTLSGFGQVRYKLAETLELAGGVRYTREHRRGYFNNQFVHQILGPAFNLVPEGDAFDESLSFSNWSPEFTLSWKPQPDVLVYGAYKTGFKSGGFSSADLYQIDASTGLKPTKDQLSFAPEKVKGAEVGFKAMLAGRTVRIEAVAYRYKYTGLQVSIFNPATFSVNIANAADARVQGVEVSGDWRATQQLTFNGSGSFNRARFLDFSRAPCYTGQPTSATVQDGFCTNGRQDLSGTPLVRAPNWTFSGGATFQTDVSSNWTMELNGDVNYSGGYYYQEDRAPGTRQSAFTRFNAGLRLFTADDRYEIALIGRNLTNKYYIESSQSKSFGAVTDFQAATPRTREVRIQLGYKF